MTKGFAFHCHHDTLFEYVYDHEERVECIKQYKPKEEQPLRLLLFKMVPDDRIPNKLLKAGVEYSKAWAEYYKAWAEYKKARAEYKEAWAEYSKAGVEYYKALAEYYKALAEYKKARVEYSKARAEYNKAWAEYYKALAEYKEEMNALHLELCPNCPWDGKSIFPEGVK